MVDLGVELDPVEGALAVAHGGGGAVLGGGQDLEVPSADLGLVAVAHPDGGFAGDAAEEAVVVGDRQVGAAVLAVVGGGDLGAEELGAEVHAVADPEDGDVEVEELGGAGGGSSAVDAGGAAGKDDAFEPVAGQFLGGDGGRIDFAVDAGLAGSPGDELRVLGAEIHDCDMVIVRHQPLGDVGS